MAILKLKVKIIAEKGFEPTILRLIRQMNPLCQHRYKGFVIYTVLTIRFLHSYRSNVYGIYRLHGQMQECQVNVVGQ
jgi:hypothetical protein